MKNITTKVYGAFYPVLPMLEEVIRNSGKDAMGNAEDWLFYEGDMLRLSFEGICFPWEEVLEALESNLPATAKGKLDILLLDEWILLRFLWDKGVFTKISRNLNDMLEPVANFR